LLSASFGSLIFFSLIFYDFFFNFFFTWNNLSLGFAIFSLFFLFGYYDSWLVKLTLVSSGFCFLGFFALNFFFWLGASLKIFFISISYCGLWVYQVRLSWLGFSFSTLYFLNFLSLILISLIIRSWILRFLFIFYAGYLSFIL